LFDLFDFLKHNISLLASTTRFCIMHVCQFSAENDIRCMISCCGIAAWQQLSWCTTEYFYRWVGLDYGNWFHVHLCVQRGSTV